ncbi:hypothetical protein BTHI11S_02076 [Bosea thiooxidans]
MFWSTTMTPTTASSSTSGTPSMDRRWSFSTPMKSLNSASAWTSSTWTVWRSRTTRPVIDPWSKRNGPLGQQLLDLFVLDAVSRDEAIFAIIPSDDGGVVGHDSPAGRASDAVEDWLKIIGRSADHLENVCRRCLPVEGVGRGRRVRAWSWSNSRTFSMAMTAWSAKVCSRAICFGVNGRTSVRRTTDAPCFRPRAAAEPRVWSGAPSGRHLVAIRERVRFLGEIVHMHRHAIEDCPSCRPVPIHGPSIQIGGDRPVMGLEDEVAAVAQENDGVIGFAELAGALRDRLQDRNDVRGRGGDGPQDLAGGDLLLQGFRQLLGPRLSFRRRGRPQPRA